MSHSTPTPRNSTRATFGSGIPVWAGPALVLGALLLGVLFSVLSGSLGVAFALLFAVGSLAAASFVRLNGLFVTVASIPVLFAGATVTGGWLQAVLTAPKGAAPFNRTALLTAAYPLIEKFPQLIIVTLAALTIAVLRLWLGTRRASSNAKKSYATRRATSAADRLNREQSSRVRERSGTLTVAELQERRRQARARAAAEQPAKSAAEQDAIAGTPAQRRHSAGSDRLSGRDREQRRLEQSRIPREERLAMPQRTPDPSLRAGQAEPEAPRMGQAPEAAQAPKRRRLDDDLYGV